MQTFVPESELGGCSKRVLPRQPLLFMPMLQWYWTQRDRVSSPHKFDFSQKKSLTLFRYSQTIPYFLCSLSVQGCVDDCNGDSTCQSACTANKHCGASNPTRVNVTSTSTSSSKTSATSAGSGGSNVDSNGFAVTGGATATGNSNPSGATRLIEAGSIYGMGLLVAGMAFGVAMVGF